MQLAILREPPRVIAFLAMFMATFLFQTAIVNGASKEKKQKNSRQKYKNFLVEIVVPESSVQREFIHLAVVDPEQLHPKAEERKPLDIDSIIQDAQRFIRSMDTYLNSPRRSTYRSSNSDNLSFERSLIIDEIVETMEASALAKSLSSFGTTVGRPGLLLLEVDLVSYSQVSKLDMITGNSFVLRSSSKNSMLLHCRLIPAANREDVLFDGYFGTASSGGLLARGYNSVEKKFLGKLVNYFDEMLRLRTDGIAIIPQQEWYAKALQSIDWLSVLKQFVIYSQALKQTSEQIMEEIRAEESGDVLPLLAKASQYYRERQYGLAEFYYRKSAEVGNAEAQFQLAEMYYKGRGVKPSYEEAIKWYRSAAQRGHTKARSYLDILKEDW